MAYKKHVTLTLDEARRHQRGEAVGTPYKPEPEPRRKMKRKYLVVPDDVRRAIAASKLPVQDTAEAFGVTVSTVCGIRREFGVARAANKKSIS